MNKIKPDKINFKSNDFVVEIAEREGSNDENASEFELAKNKDSHENNKKIDFYR